MHLTWSVDTMRALQSASIDPKSLGVLVKRHSHTIVELTALLKADEQLAAHHRIVVENLIIIQMHLRDVLQDFLEKNIVSEQDFDFTKSIRLEIDKDTQSILVQCAGADVLYGYDYEGLSQRAVITPVTDRCTIFFMHALIASVCGAFAGAADIGKSTSVTEIGKLLGRFVVIFNCHQHLDLAYLGKCFKGLPACGCFGCFDEFNRLTYPVLSACAQQLSQVLNKIYDVRLAVLAAQIFSKVSSLSNLLYELTLVLTFEDF